ncbi:MAG: energy-coupling factor transporter ATPase [Erysipelotrichaceae bacterium]
MAIQFEKVNYIYAPKTSSEYHALKDFSLTIELGKITGILGHTGSGKTTLVQHLNALLLPTKGQIKVMEFLIEPDTKIKNIKNLRKQVGLIFQFPEYQLFEETIEKDISFGPKNFGVSEEKAIIKAREMLKVVSLDASYLQASPLNISGGQKRRVAIAGILAMNPDVLILDEPTAGLDPQGAKEIMELFNKLNKNENKTIIMVTHDLTQVVEYCDNVVLLNKGELVVSTTKEDFFADDELLEKWNVKAPSLIEFQQLLIKKGVKLKKRHYNLNDLIAELGVTNE